MSLTNSSTSSSSSGPLRLLAAAETSPNPRGRSSPSPSSSSLSEAGTASPSRLEGCSVSVSGTTCPSEGSLDAGGLCPGGGGSNPGSAVFPDEFPTRCASGEGLFDRAWRWVRKGAHLAIAMADFATAAAATASAAMTTLDFGVEEDVVREREEAEMSLFDGDRRLVGGAAGGFARGAGAAGAGAGAGAGAEEATVT